MGPAPSSGPRLDLHTHSHHSKDAIYSVQEMVDTARLKGLQGLALTDHDVVDGHKDLSEVAAANPDMILLPGCEVSTKQGHLLAYDVTTAPPKRQPIAETIQDIQDQGGVAVLAHPFRFGNGVSAKTVRACEGLAVETTNGRSFESMNRKSGRLAHELQRPQTGGSDAHRTHEVGNGITLFHGSVTTAEQALEALRKGEVSAGGKGLGVVAHGWSKIRGVRRHMVRRLQGGPRKVAPADPKDGR